MRLALTYFSFHCRFSKVPALVRTVLKANLVPLKKQKHAWGKNNFLLRYRASACQACVLSDLACSTHTFKKKKSKTIPLTPIEKFGRDAVLSGKNGFLLQWRGICSFGCQLRYFCMSEFLIFYERVDAISIITVNSILIFCLSFNSRFCSLLSNGLIKMASQQSICGTTAFRQ